MPTSAKDSTQAPDLAPVCDLRKWPKMPGTGGRVQPLHILISHATKHRQLGSDCDASELVAMSLRVIVLDLYTKAVGDDLPASHFAALELLDSLAALATPEQLTQANALWNREEKRRRDV